MSTSHDQMEEIWGMGAAYSEYHIGDRICYTLEGQTHTGTIMWVCAPSNISDRNCQRAISSNQIRTRTLVM